MNRNSDGSMTARTTVSCCVEEYSGEIKPGSRAIMNPQPFGFMTAVV
jgi:hypothetical protein